MIPEGYKQTEIGIIPKDWEVVSLADICCTKGIVRGPFGGALKKEIFVDEGYKVYEQGNAIYRSIERGNYYIDTKKYNEMIRFAVNTGDFIVSCSGTIGLIYRIPENAPKGIINQALLKLTINKTQINPDYFYLYFSWDEFNKRITDDIQGGAIKNLVKMELFKKTWLLKPSVPEQEKIAEVLSDTDDLISSLEKLIEKKKAIKQGAMQNLLTGKSRLSGFNKQLENDYFNSFNIKIQKGQTITKSQLKEGCFPVVAGGRKPAYYCDIYNRDGKTITISASGASAGFVNIYSGKIFASDCSTVSESKDYDIMYIYYLLLNQQGKIYLSQTGGAQPHIHPKDINNLKVAYVRDIEEQKAIAEVLSDMDKEIEQLEQKLAKARLIKQGMMQQLFTGKIRIV